MTTGKIKWFNPTKGYGFIEQEGSKDVFLHVSALEKAGISTLEEGEEIEQKNDYILIVEDQIKIIESMEFKPKAKKGRKPKTETTEEAPTNETK